MSLTLTDKILIRLNASRNVNSFADIDPNHARIGCVGCHGGVSIVDAPDDTSAFRAAHSGLIRDPSVIGEIGCSGGSCHGEIVSRNETSMHSNLWGEKAHVALRNGYDTFAECPADIQDGYSANCSSCHTTCGQCHVSRPNAAGGGFVEQRVGYSHKFIRTPSEENVCTACHGSRIGDDWNANQERVPGNLPDVHNEYGYTCLDCHSEDLHGEGPEDANYTSRYQVSNLPQCIDCHQIDLDDNIFHRSHWPNGDKSDGPDLSCYACHAQQYNNCNTCHADRWKTEYVADNSGEYRVYPQFKLGRNPYYKQAGHPHANSDWVAIRHVPVSPDAYDGWGISIMSNHAAMETWKYASPHNIQRWTERTLVDPAWAETPDQPYTPTNCNDNCHMHGTANSMLPLNINLFLVQSDMESDITEDDLSDEIPANVLVSLGRTDVGVSDEGSYCLSCHP